MILLWWCDTCSDDVTHALMMWHLTEPHQPGDTEKETYYSVKRDLLQCQKRPITASKERSWSAPLTFRESRTFVKFQKYSVANVCTFRGALKMCAPYRLLMCHTKRRIHVCHMRRRIHVCTFSGALKMCTPYRIERPMELSKQLLTLVEKTQKIYLVKEFAPPYRIHPKP